jgi:NAD(P)-dependent dehydrogenase (short-subunit alcohol dehydrogenase family)
MSEGIREQAGARLVVVTGAGAGLGRAIARQFASDGDRLVLLGRTGAKVEAVARELGPDALPISCDVGRPEAVRAAFAQIAERCGRIDVLINNAAIYEPTLLRDATDAQIEAAATTNYLGPIYCSRAAIPLMQRGGQILNISSETVSLPHAMFSLYQSSKAGLERFTEALRAELEPDGIRVNMVRAGQMHGEDSSSPSNDPEVLRRFAEENLKRGLNLRERPISSFDSVAGLIAVLTRLPADLNVPQMVLEARRP